MSISLLQPLRELPFAFVDLETTGASADFGHRVIEIGVARVEGGRVTAQYEQLVDPQRRISAGVTALTGISQAMVDGKPTFSAELPRILDLMRGAIVVGHNVRFDLGFLRKEFRRGGQDIVQAIGDVPVLDTVRIARRRFGRGGNGLQALAPRLGVKPTAAHRALADVITTVGVFEKLLEPIGGWNLPLCDALLAQGGKMGLLPANPRESLLPLELEEALEMRKPVMMEYLDARQMRTRRVIEPRFIRRVSGELILVAHCHLRDAQRTFKLERIVQLMRIEDAPAAAAVTVDCAAEETDVPREDIRGGAAVATATGALPGREGASALTGDPQRGGDAGSLFPAWVPGERDRAADREQDDVPEEHRQDRQDEHPDEQHGVPPVDAGDQAVVERDVARGVGGGDGLGAGVSGEPRPEEQAPARVEQVEQA
jgi:DNA polymerase III epsilon subunit family exonuclease